MLKFTALHAGSNICGVITMIPDNIRELREQAESQPQFCERMEKEWLLLHSDFCSIQEHAASQICYSTEVDQFLNWSPATVHRTVAFSHSNLSINFQKQKAILSDGLLFLELLARFVTVLRSTSF